MNALRLYVMRDVGRGPRVFRRPAAPTPRRDLTSIRARVEYEMRRVREWWLVEAASAEDARHLIALHKNENGGLDLSRYWQRVNAGEGRIVAASPAALRAEVRP